METYQEQGAEDKVDGFVAEQSDSEHGALLEPLVTCGDSHPSADWATTFCNLQEKMDMLMKALKHYRILF